MANDENVAVVAAKAADIAPHVLALLPIECRYPLLDSTLVMIALEVDGAIVARARFDPAEPHWNRDSIADLRQRLYAFRRRLERTLGDEVCMEFAGQRC